MTEKPLEDQRRVLAARLRPASPVSKEITVPSLRRVAVASFAVAFLARPLGSVLFGRLGDRVGRKQTLIATLLLMGVSTAAVGLLPGAASIGVAAPVVLVALRFLQGLAVGGEWGGAALLAASTRHPIAAAGGACTRSWARGSRSRWPAARSWSPAPR